MTRDIHEERIVWRGITIEVRYEPNWLGMSRLGIQNNAHLELRSVVPKDAPLPVSETGYRSAFLSPAVIDEAGGPADYAQAWLNAEAADDPTWTQLTLL